MIHVDIQAVDELATDIGQVKDVQVPDLTGLVEKDHGTRPAQAQARQIDEFTARSVDGDGIGRIMAKMAVSSGKDIAVFPMPHLVGQLSR